LTTGARQTAKAARAAMNPYRISIGSRAGNGSACPLPDALATSTGEEVGIVGVIVTKSCRH
jgi:hypothetical protein